MVYRIHQGIDKGFKGKLLFIALVGLIIGFGIPVIAQLTDKSDIAEITQPSDSSSSQTVSQSTSTNNGNTTDGSKNLGNASASNSGSASNQTRPKSRTINNSANNSNNPTAPVGGRGGVDTAPASDECPCRILNQRLGDTSALPLTVKPLSSGSL